MGWETWGEGRVSGADDFDAEARRQRRKTRRSSGEVLFATDGVHGGMCWDGIRAASLEERMILTRRRGGSGGRRGEAAGKFSLPRTGSMVECAGMASEPRV